MSEDILAATTAAATVPTRRFVPLQIGNATVYIAQFDEPVVAEADGAVRPVALPRPQEAFENAAEFLRECVRVIGDRIDAMAEKARPTEFAVEFTLSFEVKGSASVIPVFLTGETGAKTGLKVKAKWTPGPSAGERAG